MFPQHFNGKVINYRIKNAYMLFYERVKKYQVEKPKDKEHKMEE